MKGKNEKKKIKKDVPKKALKFGSNEMERKTKESVKRWFLNSLGNRLFFNLESFYFQRGIKCTMFFYVNGTWAEKVIFLVWFFRAFKLIIF